MNFDMIILIKSFVDDAKARTLLSKLNSKLQDVIHFLNRAPFNFKSVDEI